MGNHILFSKAVIAQSVNSGIGDVPFTGWIGISATLPQNHSCKTGLLLMIHGMGSDWNEHDSITVQWANQFDLICIQVRDRHAGPRGLEIPIDLGKYQTIDCLRAVAWSMERWQINRRRIYVWGGSGGGHMALMALVMAPNLFAGGVVCAPFTHPTFPGEIEGEWQDGWIRRCIPQGPVPEDEITIRSPLRLSQRIKAPLLLMHGDADSVISVEHSRRLARVMKGRNTFEYIEISGADHDFFGGSDGMCSRKLATETAGSSVLLRCGSVEGCLPLSEQLTGAWFIHLDVLGFPSLNKMEKDHENI